MANQEYADPKRAMGTFTEPERAQAAQQELQAAGFSEQQISTDTQTFDPNPPIRQTQAVSSAKGAALIGAFLGGGIGFILGWYSPGISQLSLIYEQPLQAALVASGIGSLVGAIGTGLFGALAGVQVPEANVKTDRDRLSYRYTVEVAGNEAELEQAMDILSRKGAQVKR